MGARLDRVLVVDCEATCWATKEEQGDQPNEVIEIGICELIMATGERRNGASYVVKPRFTKITPFCTELTGWTQQAIDEGADIAPTIRQIKEDYGITSLDIWFSCGEYDRVKLGCDGRASLGGLYGVKHSDNPFSLMRHNNIKTLFALKHRLSKEMGMDRMLKHMGEKLEGRHHNGADDAWNIAKIVHYTLS
jgi:inhibitor of KinA sporulation pathway (predicted exonuclease)